MSPLKKKRPNPRPRPKAETPRQRAEIELAVERAFAIGTPLFDFVCREQARERSTWQPRRMPR